ncbi:MAG: hypothetical protein ACTSVB_09750, partial [Candidatus Heimdallarchaeaceae archaeon]
MKNLERVIVLSILLLSFLCNAQSYRETLRGAEKYFRTKKYAEAKALATKACKQAKTEEEKNSAILLLAKILVSMNEKDVARQQYQNILNSATATKFQKAEA